MCFFFLFFFLPFYSALFFLFIIIIFFFLVLKSFYFDRWKLHHSTPLPTDTRGCLLDRNSGLSSDFLLRPSARPKTIAKQSTRDDDNADIGRNQPAHVKACFLGSSLTLPISDGRLALGTWQGIWLCEHRNQAGSRKLMVTLQGCLRPDTSLGSSGGMRNSRSPAHPGADSPLASTSS